MGSLTLHIMFLVLPRLPSPMGLFSPQFQEDNLRNVVFFSDGFIVSSFDRDPFFSMIRPLVLSLFLSLSLF
jgi:hypothetical protein